jgi:glycosyltransferase involved in cell wall biosynthesis
LVAAEALCQGCYVIGLGESATPELLSSVGGIPADSIESAIDIALNAGAPELFMKKSRKEIAARARKAFSPNAMTDSYYDLYRDVLEK